MDNMKISGHVSRLAELAAGWETQGNIDPLERDMALELLRGIYAELRFEEQIPTQRQPVSCAAPEPEPLPIPVPQPENEVIPQPAPEEEPLPVPESEILTEPAAGPEPVREPEPEPLPAPEPASVAEEMPAAPRRVNPDVIRSLYGDDSPAPVAQQAVIEPKYPEEEEPGEPVSRDFLQTTPGATLGDTINNGRQTLGETLRNGEKDMASKIAASERPALKQSIGLNDKFLMIRDMFDGDGDAFNDAVSRLDGFTDLDEAIIYIHDTYDWSADSEGVKLLVELLERKLG